MPFKFERQVGESEVVRHGGGVDNDRIEPSIPQERGLCDKVELPLEIHCIEGQPSTLRGCSQGDVGYYN